MLKIVNMIENYHFGSITINGKTHNEDVEGRWNGEVLSWWRKTSHQVDFEDVKRAIKQDPEIIIIGIGASGVAEVSEKTKKEIEFNKIELIIDLTGEAVKTFNTIIEKLPEKKIIGLFHLTC
jgi:hypothetical protein